MRKSGGFRLGRKVVRIFRWFNGRRRPSRTACPRMEPASCSAGTVSKLFSWGRSLRRGAKRLCFAKNRSGYIPVGQEPVPQTKKETVSVPRGHLAVYVGEDGEDTCRVLVPVIYFNHPLFADLLRDAEKEYGFDHPGGIQIPCQKSELEGVKMKIAAASGDGGCRGRRSWGQLLMASRHQYLDH